MLDEVAKLELRIEATPKITRMITAITAGRKRVIASATRCPCAAGASWRTSSGWDAAVKPRSSWAPPAAVMPRSTFVRRPRSRRALREYAGGGGDHRFLARLRVRELVHEPALTDH